MYGDCDWTKMIPDKYTIKETLGKGGFGNVYKVKDEHINKFYALKIQKRNSFYDVAKEIEILQSLEYSGLPALHDAFYDDKYVYIVMELISGQTLEEYVKEKGKISIEETIKIAIQLANIIKYLHSRPVPVIHGDLKPENIMLAKNGVCLIDFGCAFLQYSGALDIKGTPRYAAPELIKGEIATESDIYSFGKVLVFMLTGRMIGYADDGKVQTFLEPYAVPKALCRIIKTCLQKEPRLRFRSGSELLEKLYTVKTGKGYSQGWILYGVVMFLRTAGIFLMVHFIYLWKKHIPAEEIFLLGFILLICSFAVNACVEKKYKNTILEYECNILVSEGL